MACSTDNMQAAYDNEEIEFSNLQNKLTTDIDTYTVEVSTLFDHTTHRPHVSRHSRRYQRCAESKLPFVSGSEDGGAEGLMGFPRGRKLVLAVGPRGNRAERKVSPSIRRS